MKSGIYKITNKLNGKCYIGSTKSLKRRQYNHFYLLKLGKHHSLYLQNSYNKHGKDNFEFEILIYCPITDLLLFEQWFLDIVKPEYNICKTAGSSAGAVMSEQTKQKIALSMTGKKHSEETKSKIGKASKIVADSKIAQGIKVGGFKGLSPRSIPRFMNISQFTKNGVFIKEWSTTKDISDQLGCNRARVIECCRGQRKSEKKFLWKFSKNQ